MRLRFTIRDMLLATALVAAIAGWWADHKRMSDTIEQLGSRPPAAVVEGRVFYGDSGRAAIGVRIRAQNTNLHFNDVGTAKTDDEGRYQFVNLTPGNYNIFAEVDGWTMNAIDSLPVVAGQTVMDANLQLVKGGFIKGQVVDAATGKPIALTDTGARIRIGLMGPARPKAGAAVEAVVVDSNGAFQFRAPAGTNYPYLMNVSLLSVADADYTCCSDGVVVEDGKATEIKIHIKPLPAVGTPGQPRPQPAGDQQREPTTGTK